MIQITTPRTRIERNLERIEQPIRRIEMRIIASVHDLNESLAALWRLPDDQIEEILNAKGPQELEILFTAHATTAATLNSMLEMRGIPAPRAATGLPRQFTVDEAGHITLVPLPVPPAPGPDPLEHQPS